MFGSSHGSVSAPGGRARSAVGSLLQRRRAASALCGLIVVTTLIAGNAESANAVTKRSPHHGVEARSTRSAARVRERSVSTTGPTTTTTLPSCGSPRDPFDPTNAAPPSGSPAIC